MSQVYVGNGSGGGGGGGVTGPGSSTNNSIATWNGTGGTALFSRGTPLVSSTGVMTNSNQPCFLAYLSSNQTNTTGDGTIYTIVFDTILVNQGTVYSTGTGNFTAPVAGNYLLTAGVCVANLPAGGTQLIAQISTSLSIPQYYINLSNPIAQVDPATGDFQFTGSAVIPFTASATAHVRILITGGTKTATVAGQSQGLTYFSGALLC